MKECHIASQGQLLAQHLRREPMTYMQMLKLGISTSPWKRVDEWLTLHPKWRLIKATNARGLITWRVVAAR